MFVDEVEITVKAGDGGDGLTSFRQEKFVEKGGPDGGNGGDGGDVILVADHNVNNLLDFTHRKRIEAEGGEPGGRQKRTGKSGDDVKAKVPVGTVVYFGGDVTYDFTHDGDEFVIARGGEGGLGNAHFVSSTRQAPRVAEKGEPGEEFDLRLELKIMADVGLVGLPNCGKSTFLSVVSNAKPKIANYPFTTLKPNIGVVDVDKERLFIADIPGLIEGASEGKGLGDEFLRHVERTNVLLHFVDATNESLQRDYDTIRNELSEYAVDLSKRPSLVVLTKIDELTDEEARNKQAQLQEHTGKDVVAMSSIAHRNVDSVLRAAKNVVQEERRRIAAQEEEEDDKEAVPELTLKEDPRAWHINVDDEGRLRIEGGQVEKLAKKTDFSSEPAVERFWDVMKKKGIAKELNKFEIDYGDPVYVADKKIEARI